MINDEGNKIAEGLPPMKLTQDEYFQTKMSEAMSPRAVRDSKIAEGLPPMKLTQDEYFQIKMSEAMSPRVVDVYPETITDNLDDSLHRKR